jgi:hypothetical protein
MPKATTAVPAWDIPKTMNNGVPGTGYCPGFQTASGRAPSGGSPKLGIANFRGENISEISALTDYESGRMIKFIYLQVGTDPKYLLEVRYCISTLLAEMPEAAGNIVIYTDNPRSYAVDSPNVVTCDVTSTIKEMTNRGAYFYRAKPCVVAHALRTHGCDCIFFDSDTYVRRGFARAVKRMLKRGAIMDMYLRRNPFPECTGFETVLPSGAVYRYDPATAVMYNSGVIGVGPGHLAAIEDSIAIIDAIRPLTPLHRDQEQYAINEAFRLHGVRIGTSSHVLKHYCSRWQKRYMHWRFERMADIAPTPVLPRRPRIYVNKPIGWCFKQASTLSLL